MVLAESKLRVGVIYGDPENNEYVYMPGSELGVKDPLCVYEAEGLREDVDMHEALRLKARQCREDGVGVGGVVSRHPPPGDALAGIGGIRMGRQVAQDGVDDLVEVIFLNPHAIPPRREP